MSDNVNLIGRRVCAGDGPYCLKPVTHEDDHGVYCTAHGEQRGARLGFGTHPIALPCELSSVEQSGSSPGS